MAYPPELAVSGAARYRAEDWMACGQIIPDRGVLEASYWRRLTDKVETGINCNLAFAGIGPGGPMGAPQKEGNVTIGAKYDFRQSSFRAQLDNQGKVSCLLEKMIAPPIRVTFSGEIDHKQVRLPTSFPFALPPLSFPSLPSKTDTRPECCQARSCRRDRSSRRGCHGATRTSRSRHVSGLHTLLNASPNSSLQMIIPISSSYAVLPPFLLGERECVSDASLPPSYTTPVPMQPSFSRLQKRTGRRGDIDWAMPSSTPASGSPWPFCQSGLRCDLMNASLYI